MRDPGYQRRYAVRTEQKIEAVVRCVDPTAKRYLDIGCNRGELCRRLLAFPDTHVTGIDIADVVPPELKRHDRFLWWPCDVADLSSLPRYDVTVCLAVMHHVLGHYGWNRFDSTWSMILASAPIVLLEVGIPSEGGRYYWKDRIQERFDVDEQWLAYVLERPEVLRYSSIATLSIHGSPRNIFRIDTLPV